MARPKKVTIEDLPVSKTADVDVKLVETCKHQNQGEGKCLDCGKIIN
jgi:hypothetical protein